MQTQPNTAAQPTATTTINTQTTAAAKLNEARTLVNSACRLANDESIPALTWSERDAICRQLNRAARLIAEATEAETETTTIICSECGDEVAEDQALRGECLTCAYYYAQANAF